MLQPPGSRTFRNLPPWHHDCNRLISGRTFHWVAAHFEAESPLAACARLLNLCFRLRDLPPPSERWQRGVCWRQFDLPATKHEMPIVVVLGAGNVLVVTGEAGLFLLVCRGRCRRCAR